MPKIIKTSMKRKKNYNIPTLYCFAVLKGLIIFIFGVLITSILVLKSTSQSSFIYYLSYIFIGLGAFICGFDAYKKIKGRGFVNGIISSAVYSVFVIFLAVCLMQFNVSLQLFLLLPLCLFAGFLGGTVGANT